MPYYVDSPVAGGLGFAASYLQAKNQRRDDQRKFDLDRQQQEETQRIAAANLAISQAQEGRAAQQGAIDLSGSTQLAGAKGQMRDWYKTHPAPDIGDSKAYRSYVGAEENEANQLGLDDVAKNVMSDYRASQQADEFGAMSDYTRGPKSNLTTAGVGKTQAQTGYIEAQTRFENEHARNEKNRFAHDLSMLDAKTQSQVMQSRMKINAMLAATGMRTSAAIGMNNARIKGQEKLAGQRTGASEKNNQLTNETREAISMRAAILAQQYHSDQMGLQAALAEYKGNMQEYLQNQAAGLQGKATPSGFDQTGSMPTINLNMQGQPGQPPQQQQPPQIYIINMRTADGKTVQVPIPVTPQKHPVVGTKGNLHPAGAAPQQQSALQGLENALGGAGSWLMKNL